jgi:predicted RNase H-like HicB family nuclease
LIENLAHGRGRPREQSKQLSDISQVSSLKLEAWIVGRVWFEPAEEGGFVVTCPALPGLVTEGDTLEEARAMAQDAILAYLESLRTTNWSHGQRFLKLL